MMFIFTSLHLSFFGISPLFRMEMMTPGRLGFFWVTVHHAKIYISTTLMIVSIVITCYKPMDPMVTFSHSPSHDGS